MAASQFFMSLMDGGNPWFVVLSSRKEAFLGFGFGFAILSPRKEAFLDCSIMLLTACLSCHVLIGLLCVIPFSMSAVSASTFWFCMLAAID